MARSPRNHEQAYRNFIYSIQLEEIRLTKMEVKLDESVLTNSSVESTRPQFSPSFSVKVDGVYVIASARAKVSVDVVGRDNDDIVPLISMKLAFRLRYRIADSEFVNPGVLRLFKERNVPVNAWPYMREIVSNTTVRMGFPALVIPVRRR